MDPKYKPCNRNKSAALMTPPVQPSERKKPMDKVKPPPPKSRTWERER